MNCMSRERQDRRAGQQGRQGGAGPMGPDRNWRWVVFVLLALLVAVIVLPNMASSTTRKPLSYGEFINQVTAKPPTVKNITVNNNTGKITGELTDGTKYAVNGPQPATDDQIKTLKDSGIDLKFENSSS